jgi:hypothetical protein
MAYETPVEPRTERKFYLDAPPDLRAGEKLTFILSLHGGGSNGKWQHEYFPAADFADKYRLVIATPTAATTEPARHWVSEADDKYLEGIVEAVFARFGKQNIRSFWLAGHSQGGMTSNRLIRTPYFRDRVDGWLSLSGGRIGAAPRAENFGPPGGSRLRPGGGAIPQPPQGLPDLDMSFIYTTGEHEIASLPETSPWAQKYGAAARRREADIVDDKPGKIYDTLREGKSSKSWGLYPRPGTAEFYRYPNARDDRVIADIVRIDKGHTEGLEPNVTEALIKLIVEAPGGKAQRAV